MGNLRGKLPTAQQLGAEPIEAGETSAEWDARVLVDAFWQEETPSEWSLSDCEIEIAKRAYAAGRSASGGQRTYTWRNGDPRRVTKGLDDGEVRWQAETLHGMLDKRKVPRGDSEDNFSLWGRVEAALAAPAAPELSEEQVNSIQVEIARLCSYGCACDLRNGYVCGVHKLGDEVKTNVIAMLRSKAGGK